MQLNRFLKQMHRLFAQGVLHLQQINFRRLSGAIALSVPFGSSPSSADFQPKSFAYRDDAVALRASQSCTVNMLARCAAQLRRLKVETFLDVCYRVIKIAMT